jgi:hypothetical protein
MTTRLARTLLAIGLAGGVLVGTAGVAGAGPGPANDLRNFGSFATRPEPALVSAWQGGYGYAVQLAAEPMLDTWTGEAQQASLDWEDDWFSDFLSAFGLDWEDDWFDDGAYGSVSAESAPLFFLDGRTLRPLEV